MAPFFRRFARNKVAKCFLPMSATLCFSMHDMTILNTIRTSARVITIIVVVLLVIFIIGIFGFEPAIQPFKEFGCIQKDNAILVNYIAFPLFVGYFAEAFYSSYKMTQDNKTAFKRMFSGSNQTELGSALSELVKMAFGLHVLIYSILRC